MIKNTMEMTHLSATLNRLTHLIATLDLTLAKVDTFYMNPLHLNHLG